jgi:hypothetical protein
MGNTFNKKIFLTPQQKKERKQHNSEEKTILRGRMPASGKRRSCCSSPRRQHVSEPDSVRPRACAKLTQNDKEIAFLIFFL